MDVATLKTTVSQIGYFIAIILECVFIAVIVLAILVGLAWVYFEGKTLLKEWIAKKRRIRAKKEK